VQRNREREADLDYAWTHGGFMPDGKGGYILKPSAED
jgi:hypothetical protein